MKTLSQLQKIMTVLATRRLSFDVDFIPCRFHGISSAKVSNWLLTESSVRFKPAWPWGFPTIMQVEVSSRCNLSCPMCPVSIGLDRPAGHMDLGLFHKGRRRKAPGGFKDAFGQLEVHCDGAQRTGSPPAGRFCLCSWR